MFIHRLQMQMQNRLPRIWPATVSLATAHGNGLMFIAKPGRYSGIIMNARAQPSHHLTICNPFRRVQYTQRKLNMPWATCIIIKYMHGPKVTTWYRKQCSSTLSILSKPGIRMDQVYLNGHP